MAFGVCSGINIQRGGGDTSTNFSDAYIKVSGSGCGFMVQGFRILGLGVWGFGKIIE